MGNLFGLPSTVAVNRTMPKKAFYERLSISTAIKDEFVQCIDRIEMLASIKETSIHIPKAQGIQEIDVLGLYLKEVNGSSAVPYGAIDVIARAIPNKLLFACLVNEQCKLLVFRGRLRETDWCLQDEVLLSLKGETLAELWDSIGSQVIFGTDDPADLEDRLQRRERIKSLEKELETVNRKRKTEKQVAKRNALFDRRRTIEAELSQLKGNA